MPVRKNRLVKLSETCGQNVTTRPQGYYLVSKLGGGSLQTSKQAQKNSRFVTLRISDFFCVGGLQGRARAKITCFEGASELEHRELDVKMLVTKQTVCVVRIFGCGSQKPQCNVIKSNQ